MNLTGQRDAVAMVAAFLDGDKEGLGALVDAIQNVEELRDLIRGLLQTAAVLATVGAAASSQATGGPVEPRVALRSLALLLAEK